MNILQKEKRKIEQSYYMSPILETYREFKDRHGTIEVFDYLHDIMRNSQDSVEELIRERVIQGEIKDPNQARKTVAGNSFQFLILYALIENIEEGNLPNSLIVLKTKQHKVLDEYATIEVAGETQKPDIDLLVFTEDERHPVMIYSCKTSLRERAGQTYKWKLLVEITKKCPQLKEEYQLKYPEKRKVLTGFITTNFYDEINQPQQRGMLKFFDYAYIAKPIEPLPHIKPLSQIIKDLNQIFS
ncbi:BsaWI family type II restriction enzyme [Persephonella sp.]